MRKLLLLLGFAFINNIQASDLTIPNTFVAGTIAVANDVNANFVAVETAVDDNNSRIAALEAQIQALEAMVVSLQAASVPNLSTYLRIDETDPQRPTALFEAVNVKIVNGSGTTAGFVNGLGNLIVGYDEPSTAILNDKGGSHNLVVGSEHGYGSFGGFVAGFQNTIAADFATVSGGTLNIASGMSSSVSGGSTNSAEARESSISGGFTNITSGVRASVSGGQRNTASALYSSISAGFFNTASQIYASVSGGRSNIASAQYSSVSGGTRNIASGENSSVSGGNGRSAGSTDDWAAGSLFEDN